MTTATAPAAARRTPRAWSAVLRAELRLFSREPTALFWIVVFPPVLLGILGLIPSFRADNEDLGLRIIDAYVPIVVLTALIMAALQAMPTVLTGYRERGILRRMATTPVRPAALIGAQMGLHGAAGLLSALLSLLVGKLAFDVNLPSQAGGYLLALLLAVLTALSMGALASALARTAKTANTIGAALFFPMVFSAGLWLPVQEMPDVLRHIVEALPFGAAAQALHEATVGDWPAWSHLGVMALWTVVVCGAAARWFRWQ